jgi:hypothetical protein
VKFRSEHRPMPNAMSHRKHTREIAPPSDRPPLSPWQIFFKSQVPRPASCRQVLRGRRSKPAVPITATQRCCSSPCMGSFSPTRDGPRFASLGGPRLRGDKQQSWWDQTPIREEILYLSTIDCPAMEGFRSRRPWFDQSLKAGVKLSSQIAD